MSNVVESLESFRSAREGFFGTASNQSLASPVSNGLRVYLTSNKAVARGAALVWDADEGACDGVTHVGGGAVRFDVAGTYRVDVFMSTPGAQTNKYILTDSDGNYWIFSPNMCCMSGIHTFTAGRTVYLSPDTSGITTFSGPEGYGAGEGNLTMPTAMLIQRFL